MPTQLDEAIIQLGEAMRRVTEGELQLDELKVQLNLLRSRGEATEETERVLSALSETIALWRVHCALLEESINQNSPLQ